MTREPVSAYADSTLADRPARSSRLRRPGGWGGFALLAVVGVVAAACGGGGSGSKSTSGSSASPTGSGVVRTEKTGLGTILVDGSGKTIYVFAIDKPGTSACTGTCLQYWPIVAAPGTAPTQVAGVTAKLGVLDRPDGGKQLTVAGWPVYTFSGDTRPGMTSGQGKKLSGGLWWVVSPSGAWIKTGSGGPAASPSSSGGYTRGY